MGTPTLRDTTRNSDCFVPWTLSRLILSSELCQGPLWYLVPFLPLSSSGFRELPSRAFVHLVARRVALSLADGVYRVFLTSRS